MRKSVAWYRDVLGFEVLQTHEPDGHFYWAMLKLGDSVLMLNARYEDDDRPPTQPDSVPGHDDLTLYFDCLDVDAAYAHLGSKGCQVKEPRITYYGMKQLTVNDPDGFELCFQQAAK
jgi:uncharacterized glyoxalase superfamily protein PhnB